MKTIKKGILLGTASLALSLSLSTALDAYVTSGHKWSSSNVKFYYDNYNSGNAKTAFATGAAAWSGLDAKLTYNAQYNVYCTEVSVSNVSWDGMTTSHYSGGYNTSQTLKLNTAATNTWNNSGARKSVAVHEFGHVFGLGDNGTTKTIMNGYTWGANSRYGAYGFTTPQSDDKSGINKLY